MPKFKLTVSELSNVLGISNTVEQSNQIRRYAEKHGLDMSKGQFKFNSQSGTVWYGDDLSYDHIVGELVSLDGMLTVHVKVPLLDNGEYIQFLSYENRWFIFDNAEEPPGILHYREVIALAIAPEMVIKKGN